MNKAITVLVSVDSSSILMGSRHFKNYLISLVSRYNLDSVVEILETGSFGRYDRGVLMMLLPDSVVYAMTSEKDVELFVTEQLLKGRRVDKLIVKDFEPAGAIETTVVSEEMRVVLKNAGRVNPRDIEEYIAREGYQALGKALGTKPEEVIAEIRKSNLRGRGGAGFPTGLKWEFTSRTEAPEKYVICNADEGEPGTFKDRLIMEGDPHLVIEGMAIAAYAVGASRGYVYIRGEYYESVDNLRTAIRQAYEYGLLGENILGTEFAFDLSVRLGAGAYICGEETALIESIEGKSGRPRLRPPYPPVKGVHQLPTVVNNVETFGCVPHIVNRGADWFLSIGTDSSPGTKVYSLCGNLVKRGIVEVPMGTTTADLIYSFGGGIAGGRTLKMIQTGGAAGTFIKPDEISFPLDFDSMRNHNVSLGSGVILAIDDTHCAVDIGLNLMEFFAHESCGKCTPCREGTRMIIHLLGQISKGKGTPDMIDHLYSISSTMEDASFCGLGQSVPVPLRSLLDRFRSEIEDHIGAETCPLEVCKFEKPAKQKARRW